MSTIYHRKYGQNCYANGYNMETDNYPKILYKYYAPTCRYIFQNSTIRFTPLSEFNDPFEGRVAFNHIYSKSYYRKHIQSSIMNMSYKSFEREITAYDKKLLVQQLLQGALKRFGVFCLTSRPDNLLMWSHYAQAHMGYVIGFDMSSNFFKFNENKDKIWFPRPVNYVSKRIIFDNLCDEIWSDKLIDFIYTKADEWKYEEEYRMLTSLVNYDEKFQPYKDKSIYIVPPNAIKEIILGYNFQEKDLQDLRLFLHKNIQYSHVSLKRIELDSLEYKLNIVSQ